MSKETEPRPSTSGVKGPGIEPDQDPAGFWHLRISRDLTISLSYNRNAYRPVRVHLAKGAVTLDEGEQDLLIAFLAFTRRYLKQGVYGYKWTMATPQRTHVPVKFRHFIGVFERNFRSQRDLDFSHDAQN